MREELNDAVDLHNLMFQIVADHFDRDTLKRVCEMREEEFGAYYEMGTTFVKQPEPDNFYFHKDNGSNILAVAHLDTVMPHEGRTANFVETAAGPIVFSGALDDRLGAYIILELLPKIGLKYDWLLTVGEESGRSTASFFDTEKEYNWMIEFDRGGTDVVMYDYDDNETRGLVSATGAQVGNGIFSDICYLEHLEIKGFNWGVGYRDYHGPRSHAYLNDTMKMVAHFLSFHEANHETYLPHEYVPKSYSYGGLRSYTSLEYMDWWDRYDPDTGTTSGGKDDEVEGEVIEKYEPDPDKECEVCGEKGGVDIAAEICVKCDYCLACFMARKFCECSWNNGRTGSDDPALWAMG